MIHAGENVLDPESRVGAGDLDPRGAASDE
jgi:hypothetical protein